MLVPPSNRISSGDAMDTFRRTLRKGDERKYLVEQYEELLRTATDVQLALLYQRTVMFLKDN